MLRGVSLFVTLAFAVLFLTPIPASAQQISLPTFLERDEEFRPDAQEPYWINQRDCLRDDVLHFDLRLTGFSGFALQVWAGSSGDNCETKAERENQGSCWLVADESPSNETWRTSIRAQDIVARRTPSDRDSGPGEAGPEACAASSASTGVPIFLYFMLVDLAGNIQGEAAIWDDTGFDVTGPNPPTGVSARPGERKLLLSWDATVAGDLSGYRFYCDAGSASTSTTSQTQQALEGGVDGGAVTDAAAPSGDGGTASGGASGSDGGGGGGGDDGGFVIPSNCPPTSLRPGDLPTSGVVRCGSSGRSSTSGFADGLENGVTAAVAIAAVDNLGNSGPLSEVVCGVPEVVFDFYEIYKSAGGGGGGGYCTTGQRPNGIAAIGAGFIALAWAARRRARR